MRSILRNVLFFWESRVAPLIAIYFAWAFWPLYRLLKAYNICFVVNIAGGTGHIICELDLFLRKLLTCEIDTKKRYIWIRRNDHFSATCVKFYKHYFWYAKASYLLYELTLPLTIRFKEITLDSGLSGLQWQLDIHGNYIRPIANQSYLNLLPLPKLTELWNHYFKLKTKTNHYFPLVLAKTPWTQLESLLGPEVQKKALIHLKETKANATVTPTDPTTYLPALQHLQSEHFQLVFVGREKMPACFADYGVINYAQSPLASFAHDIALFQSCTLAILGGSGIAYLADCWNKPYLYINSWHLPTPVPSSRAILVPTLLRKPSGQLFSFHEQIHLFLTTQSDGSVAGLNTFSAKNATADEILAALHELERLDHTPKTALQQYVSQMAPLTPLSFAASRYSESFLQKHRSLLSEPS